MENTHTEIAERVDLLSLELCKSAFDLMPDATSMEMWLAMAVSMGRIMAFGVPKESWEVQMDAARKLTLITAEVTLPEADKIIKKCGTGDN